jgi:transcriptional regulator GlxA family with amidase domain
MTSPSPTHVAIVVFDEVEVLDCCGPFEVFSVANRAAVRRGEAEPFVVRMVAADREVVSRGGLVLRAHATIDEDPPVDVLVVAGGVTDDVEKDARVTDWVARVRPRLTTSVCTGAFVLAEAGVLTGQQVTTHWDDQAALAERFPALTVLPDRRWVRDGDVFTSGGISAGIDLALHLVEVVAGRELADATAHLMEYRWVDEPTA